MSFIRKQPFLFGGILFLGLVVLPLTIFFISQQQENRSRAEKTVDLSYDPSASQSASLLQIPAGSTFTVDVYMDPGTNAVSYLKVEMVFDPTKFEPAGGFIPNMQAFSQVQGSVVTTGKETVTLSVGSDFTKAVKTKTKIGTLSLKALDNVPANTITQIGFGTGTEALSVSSNSSFDENVIATTTPISVQINKPITTCGNSPADVVLDLDTSDSMLDKVGSGTKLSYAKAAAINFINIIAKAVTIRVGFVTFDVGSVLRSPLTFNFATVKSIITNDTHTGNHTCIQCGILTANQEISAHKRAGVKNIVILLTDGRANSVQGKTGYVSNTIAEQAALDAAAAGHKTNGTIYYTIGLGNDVFSDFLKKLATDNGGKYYFAPTADQLNGIYQQISQVLDGGSVTGMVFNDANGNGSYDQGETPMHGILVKLFQSNSSTPSQIISSSSDGTYSLQHICDGSYTLRQELPPTWKQTLPKTKSYSISMTNGNALTDKNFGDQQLPRCSDGIDNDGNGYTDAQDSTCHTDGNPGNTGSYDPNLDGEHGNSTCSDSKDNNNNGLIDGADPVCHTDGDPTNPTSYDPTRDEGYLPTPTPSEAPTPTVEPTVTTAPTPSPNPNGTQFNLNVLMHGIGNSGDNANPNEFSLSNRTPVHPSRDATALIYDVNNNVAATAAGQILYTDSSGSFVGTVSTASPVAAGNYTIKIQSPYHLTRTVSGIQTIGTGTTVGPLNVTLVAGDANNDNTLNILDYNLILDCYSDLSPAVNCDDTKKVATDLNDDGNVNQFDYNLFLREISTQPGD